MNFFSFWNQIEGETRSTVTMDEIETMKETESWNSEYPSHHPAIAAGGGCGSAESAPKNAAAATPWTRHAGRKRSENRTRTFFSLFLGEIVAVRRRVAQNDPPLTEKRAAAAGIFSSLIFFKFSRWVRHRRHCSELILNLDNLDDECSCCAPVRCLSLDESDAQDKTLEKKSVPKSGAESDDPEPSDWMGVVIATLATSKQVEMIEKRRRCLVHCFGRRPKSRPFRNEEETHTHTHTPATSVCVCVCKRDNNFSGVLS